MTSAALSTCSYSTDLHNAALTLPPVATTPTPAAPPALPPGWEEVCTLGGHREIMILHYIEWKLS